jgi:NAD(P)-dependent dehydrogenase (short-subunit alcohol dehydrogenase family)
MNTEALLKGAKAVVMGADKPVAAAIALALAEAGADVACTSTTGNPEEAFALRPLRRKIEGFGKQAIADIADLGNGSSVQIAVRQIGKQFGDLHILVLEPRDVMLKAADRMSDSEWTRVLGFNLDAYFYAARAFAREVADNTTSPKGRIIAILPPAATESGSAALEAARAGAGGLVAALAQEWGPDILVNAIALPAGGDEEWVTTRAVAESLRFAVSFVSGEIVRIS